MEEHQGIKTSPSARACQCLCPHVPHAAARKPENSPIRQQREKKKQEFVVSDARERNKPKKQTLSRPSSVSTPSLPLRTYSSD